MLLDGNGCAIYKMYREDTSYTGTFSVPAKNLVREEETDGATGDSDPLYRYSRPCQYLCRPLVFRFVEIGYQLVEKNFFYAKNR
jgi:hypothetical protein